MVLKVNWEEYEQLIYKLYEKVKYEPFDQILCIGRGGFLIGDILSRVCEKPLSVILASSYNGKEQNHPASRHAGDKIDQIHHHRLGT